MELLVVGAEQLFRALAVGGRGEQLTPEILERDARDAGEALRHGDVLLRAGRGLEHDGVGEYGRGHKPRHLGRGCDPVLLIHGGYDGVRAADRLISDGDGLAGLDIGEAVVVDYLKYLNLIQPVHGLRGLVVIHEHDALALRAQQVEARQRSHNVVVLVQNRIAAVAALQHQLAHVVEVIG